MISKIKNLFRIEFLKVSLFSGFSSVIKVLSSFVVSKLTAVYIGVSGLAILGQMTSVVNIVILISSFGMTTGITKYVAQFKESKSEINEWLSSANIVLIIACFVATTSLIVFSQDFSNLLFKSDEYADFFKILGVCVPLFSLNRYFLAVSNGYKDFKVYNTINAISNVLILIYSSILIYMYGLDGGLVAVVTGQAIVVVLSTIFLFKRVKSIFRSALVFIKMPKVKSYLQYSLNTLVSTVLTSNLPNIDQRGINKHVFFARDGPLGGNE